MSHVASRKADKKHGEPVQVKVEEDSAEAAILRMMGTRQEKERVAEGEAADASQQAPPPAAAAAPSQAPAAGASPAKQARNRDTTPNKAREGTSGAGTPTKSRPGSAATPSPSRIRGGSAGGA